MPGDSSTIREVAAVSSRVTTAIMTAMPCSAAKLDKVDHFLFGCAYESAEKEHATVCGRD